MKRDLILLVLAGGALMWAPSAGIAAASPTNLWQLAQDSRSLHRFSTTVKAQEMQALFTNDEALDRAVAWCRQNGITRVYLETFRFGYLVERPLLEKVLGRFRRGGIETDGLVTPTRIGKASTGWNVACCYTDLPTQRRTREIFEYTASFFDTVLIDDFWFTDCACEACAKAMAAQTVTVGTQVYPVEKAGWSHYRRELMCRLAEENVVKPCRAVNPKVRVIVKFPCWYDGFQDKGYDVPRMSAIFDGTWVGTETRDYAGSWGGTPQMAAFFIARWVVAASGGRCAGAWYDPLGTSPSTYLEQARLTVLGGMAESVLHSYGYLSMTTDEAAKLDDSVTRLNLKGVGGLGSPCGPQDIAYLRGQLPELIAVAREVKARKLTGIAAYKPANSGPHGETAVFSFAGMLGLPLNPCQAFPSEAPAAFFAAYLGSVPDADRLINAYIATGRPTLVTDGLAQALKGKIAVNAPNVVILPVKGYPPSLLQLTQKEVDTLRTPFVKALGHQAFEAPNQVGLFLFADQSWVIMNFNDRPITLRLDGETREVAARQWLLHWTKMN